MRTNHFRRGSEINFKMMFLSSLVVLLFVWNVSSNPIYLKEHEAILIDDVVLSQKRNVHEIDPAFSSKPVTVKAAVKAAVKSFARVPPSAHSPSRSPTKHSTIKPSGHLTARPTQKMTLRPSNRPTVALSTRPSTKPSIAPSHFPTEKPTDLPSLAPTVVTPTSVPTQVLWSGTGCSCFFLDGLPAVGYVCVSDSCYSCYSEHDTKIYCPDGKYMLFCDTGYHSSEDRSSCTENVPSSAPTLKPSMAPTAAADLIYHGGNIMPHVNMYHIWFGSFDVNTISLVDYFATNINGSAWLNIGKSLYNNQNQHIQNSVDLVKSVQVSSAQSWSVDPATIITNLINAGTLPIDTEGSYVIFFGDIDVSGFTTSWCGYHSHLTLMFSSTNYVLKFSMVGDPTGVRAKICVCIWR